MKKAIRYLKIIIASLVLLVGATTSSYGANVHNIFSNMFGEQVGGLQLAGSAPEPETMLLLGIGLLLLATVLRRGKKKQS